MDNSQPEPGDDAGEVPLMRLVQALDDRRLHVRVNAIAALGRRGTLEAVAVLCKALQSRDPVVRLEAARVLGRVGSAAAASALCGALADRAPEVRDQAAAALVQMGAAAVEPLSALLAHRQSQVRASAAEALCQISDPRAVRPLCVVLERGHLANARRVVEWLGEMGDASAVPVLCRLLKDTGWVGDAAVEALGKLAAPEAVDALARMLNGEESAGQRRAIAVLGSIGGPQALEVLRSRLVELGSDRFAEMDTEELRRLEAALIQIGPAVVDRMLPLLNGAPAVRLSAVRVLRAFAVPAVVAGLCFVLTDPLPLIRRHAVLALAEIRDAAAIESLVPLLQDDDFSVRGVAASTLELLGWQPPDAHVRILVALVQGDCEAAGREGEAALETLLPLLQWGDSALRASAAHALGWTASRAALPALHERLRWFRGEPSGTVREAVETAIWRIEAATRATSYRPRSEPSGPEPEGRPRTDEQSPARDRRPRST